MQTNGESLVKRNADILSLCIHRTFLALILCKCILAIVFIGTVEVNVAVSLVNYTRGAASALDRRSKGDNYSSHLESMRPPLRSFRFASLDSFLAAVRSSHSLDDVTRYVIRPTNHSLRSRRHRNARICSPLLCGDDDGSGGGTGQCPHERQRRQQMAESTARQCVHVVGHQSSLDSKEQVDIIMAAKQATEIFEASCSLWHLHCRPQPEIFPVNQLCKMSSNFQYYPPYAVLHRCPSTVPCCGEYTRCEPLPDSVKNVSFSFYVLEASGPITESQLEWHSVETFTFENHTACNCTRTGAQQLNDGFVEPTNETTREFQTSKNLTSSKRKHICTRCPKPFICHKNLKRNRCRCKCKIEDKNCREIMRGLRPLNKSQQKCVRLHLCFEPKCFRRLVYNRKSGKCVQPSAVIEISGAPQLSADKQLISESEEKLGEGLNKGSSRESVQELRKDTGGADEILETISTGPIDKASKADTTAESNLEHSGENMPILN